MLTRKSFAFLLLAMLLAACAARPAALPMPTGTATLIPPTSTPTGTPTVTPLPPLDIGLVGVAGATLTIRFWIFIPEFGKYLRVVTLDDGETVHNAFPDRNFQETRR